MSKIILLMLLIISILNLNIKQINTNTISSRTTMEYPIRVGYVDHNHYWYGDNIASGLGVPGYAKPHNYNVINLAFWSCNKAPKDMALIWSQAYPRFGPKNSFGNDTDSVQKALKKIYNQNGIKIMVSAFGDGEFPTTLREDPIACGYQLGNFVVKNNFDGADIDWEDNKAMNSGGGQQWIIDFTMALREMIPNHIVSHAPQAPYFKNEYYKNGGYITVNKAVGHLIDFYMIQFYNQVNSKYNSYEQLFIHATGDVFNGTAVKEIADRGIPLWKIVVGKPVTSRDVSNTGFVNQTDLGLWGAKAFDQFKWFGGYGHWQYPSDLTGKASFDAFGPLQTKCKEQGSCKPPND